MIERVLLDMDGVLADFIGGAMAFHGKDYPHYPHDPDTQVEQMPWDIERVFNMNPHALWSNLGRTFWRNLKPLPQFNHYVSSLEEKFGVDRICLLTSPPRSEGAVEGKLDWIREYLPQYRRQFLIGPAKEFCASPHHVLVDDHEVNIQKFRDAGGHGFLVPAPWNSRFGENAVTALDEWLESLG